jgi:predicted dehydrogenase/aryl-alcohol dehydrogenase-like predicted oxidoreductase
MTDKLNWGIIGCGGIAAKFAKGLAATDTGELLAAGSRTKDKAEAFAEKHGAARAYGSYENLLADDDVQAVYIATPHTSHAEWTVKSAEAGKHILCEKPLAVNHGEAMQAVEAARRHGVFLMEAFMYRCHPQTTRLVELVREGVIGDVRFIRAAFGFAAKYNPEGRLFKNALAGGGILDVGCYPVSLARLVAGAASDRDFLDPDEVRAVGTLTETGVDACTPAVLKFPNGIVAEVSTAVQVQLANDAYIFGTGGSIYVPEPWQPGRSGPPKIVVRRSGEEPQEIEVPGGDIYAYEADVVAANLDARQAPSPATSTDDSLGNMKVLDDWRAAIGQEYDFEKPEAVRTVTGRPLARRPDSVMKYGDIPGVGKKISRLVMGVDNQAAMPHTAAMFDDFFERGGNAFDSAFIYKGGACERMLGQWILNRGVREDVVILDKGAHTPHCTPDGFARQFAQSIERLQTDYVDIYMLHRDNPEVPVGEWMDALNEEVQAGRIRALGGSNWTPERIDPANEYAKGKGLAPFVAVSNNLSLARMNVAPWVGCVTASDPEIFEWHRRTGMTLMPWSSQARGFFTGRAHPEDRSDEELVRCWYSDENFERLGRAEKMAAERNAPTIAVALAWVLNLDFPTFPLIGPRLISETRTSFQALELELTPEDVAWLNLES